MDIFIYVALALALFALGASVGALVENTRIHSVNALERVARVEEDNLRILPVVLSSLETQNKKLDTLVMRQAYDPNSTQDIPVMQDY